MDFMKLLGLAEDKQNDKAINASNVKTFCTKVPPPTKDPKQKKLSENVKKYLQSQSSQVQLKQQQDEEKRKNLLQLRAENKKSQRAMKSMLQMTKSANKSALPCVKPETKLQEQCDEDDYGYESAHAHAFFKKFISKYDKPAQDPMTKLLKPKPEVKASTVSVRDKPVSKDEKSYKKNEEPVQKAPEVAKRKSLPPPPSFSELIKMAEQGKGKVIDVKPKLIKEFEFDRPMTAKEKEEHKREKLSQLRKSGKVTASVPQPAAAKATTSAAPPGKPAVSAKVSPPSKEPSTSPDKSQGQAKSLKKEVKNESPLPSRSEQKPVVKKEIVGPEFHPAVVKPAPKPTATSPSSSTSVKSRPKNGIAIKTVSKRPRSRSVSRSPSPVAYRSSSKMKGNKMRIDSESEVDSEMDDFIDDSESNVDVSSIIGKLFRYDRSKYRYEDDADDRSMEVRRFADVMKEEARSAKIGRMEDLEDMQREEEEKRRKLAAKKQRRK